MTNVDLTGKTALVTGAGKGIGRDIAVYLTERGASVVAVSRTQADLDSLRAQIGCRTIAADLGDAAQARRAAEDARPVELLVNNAGVSRPQSFLQTTVAAFDETVHVNVRAALIVTQIVAADLIARGVGGAIVNVSSTASTRALPDHTAYCVSKGALDQLTRMMALELGPHGIRVNSVNPTVTLTPMGEMAWGDPAKSEPMRARIPLGRFAVPREIAHAVAFLLSDDAAMVHGAFLPVDGGFLVT